ncbi:MAG: hypothetical protein RLZZ450_3557 [Pseudomonadota bacterium]|jgi:hypothetical protein
MIERIILFKLNDPATREECAALTVAALDEIDAIEELSVGVPADASSEKSWDLSLVLGVANLALLDTVLAGEAFTAFLDGEMKPRSTVIKAWSFERLG